MGNSRGLTTERAPWAKTGWVVCVSTPPGIPRTNTNTSFQSKLKHYGKPNTSEAKQSLYSAILFPGWILLLLCENCAKKRAVTSKNGLEKKKKKNMTSTIKNFYFTTPSCYCWSSKEHCATTDADEWLTNSWCSKLFSVHGARSQLINWWKKKVLTDKMFDPLWETERCLSCCGLSALQPLWPPRVWCLLFRSVAPKHTHGKIVTTVRANLQMIILMSLWLYLLDMLFSKHNHVITCTVLPPLTVMWGGGGYLVCFKTC